MCISRCRQKYRDILFTEEATNQTRKEVNNEHNVHRGRIKNDVERVQKGALQEISS